MEIREVTNSATSLDSASRTSHKGKSTIAVEYAQLLAKKLSTVKADVRAMEAIQNQLNEIRDLHEDLTGEVKVDEDSGNANRDEGSAVSIKPTETIKRFMPDGSIMITTYEGSKIVDQVKHKPHMISVPDYAAPPKPDGSVATKWEARQNFELEMLLMM